MVITPSLHIDYAKDAYRAKNKRDYVEQMTIWLRRQEAVNQFTAYLDWCSSVENNDVDNSDDDSDDEAKIQELEEDDHQGHAVQGPFFLAVEPGPFPALPISRLTTNFHASNFLTGLALYLHQTSHGSRSIPIPTEHDCFDVYIRVSIPWNNICAVQMGKHVDRIHTTPIMLGKPGCGPMAGHFDTVLVRIDNEINDHTKGTFLEGLFPSTSLASFRSHVGLGLRVAQIRVIFTLPSHL
jgi:hypothetical protein